MSSPALGAMKVVVDCRYICEKPSGIGAYVQALVDRTPALAPDTQFVFWRHPGAEAPLSTASNTTDHRSFGTPNEPVSLLFPRLFGPTEGDVFHSPHNLLPRGIRAAAVTTVHDLMWLDAPHLIDASAARRALRVPFFRAGILTALRRSTRILTVSGASARAIEAFLPDTKGRVVVTHNAAAPWFVPANDRSAARARATELLGTDAPFFLLVGQNQPSKGHEIALEAFARAARPEERLVLVQRLRPGQGLDRLARALGVRDRLLLRPALPREELVTLLHAAITLLQPSLAEGFGMPALEALAAGCPVIASDIAPLVEVLGGAGVHVPAGSSEELGRAMRRVADANAMQDDLREKGLERAKAFSWDETAKTTVEVYRDAAREGPRR